MKKLLFTILAVSLFAACESDTDFQSTSSDIPEAMKGQWVSYLSKGGTERVISFAEGSRTATYSSTAFAPCLSRETLNVPYTYDNRKSELTMDFQGLHTQEGIRSILFSRMDENCMAGVINYADAQAKPDTVLMLSAPEQTAFGQSANPPQESTAEAKRGPQSLQDQIDALRWKNPISPTSGSPVATRGIATDILLWAGDQLLSTAGFDVADELLGVMWGSLFPSEDETAKNIEQIMDDIAVIKKDLSAVNAKVDQLVRQQRLTELMQVLTDRNNRFQELYISTSNTLKTINRIVKDSASTPEGKDAAIARAITQWGESSYYNNYHYDAAMVYAAKAMQAYADISFPDIYDKFAYETNEWEHTGYEWREMLRTTDMAVVASCAHLTMLYWMAQHKLHPQSVTPAMVTGYAEDLSKVLKQMDDFYKQKAVERHPDLMICQIPGLHLTFKKQLEWRDLGNPTWYGTLQDYYFKRNGKNLPLDIDYLLYANDESPIYLHKERFLTSDEYDKLNNYYADSKGSLLELLSSIGFDINAKVSPDETRAMMVLPDGCYFIPTPKLDRNDDLYFKAAIRNYSRCKDYNVKIGEIWAPLVDNRFSSFIRNTKRFERYVDYEDKLWFNLEVVR